MVRAQARPRPKHIPRRTCVGCGTTSAKREFIRVVRTPEGRVEPDPTGRRPGRGAYLCASPACWQQALRRSRLERALRTVISPQERADLLEFARGLGLPIEE